MDVPEDPSRADPTTIQDKFLVEYMAIYTCPGDGEPIWPGHQGWSGWYDEHIPDMEQPLFDIWPDMSSYSPSELYPVPGVTNSLNEQMHLHFRWMREHEVDGALLNRWASNLVVGRESIVKLCDGILDNVRAAAEKEGRVFAIEYSFSHTPTLTLLDDLTRDWKHLIHDKDLLASSSYLRENGKPVISLIYFGDRQTVHSPGLIRLIVAMFRSVTPGGVYIIGILPSGWKSGLTDPSKNPELIDVWLSEFDAIGPNITPNNRERMQGDKDFITAWLADRGVGRKIDYIPTVYPGESVYNYDGADSESDINITQRDGGRFLWKQLYSASRLGVRTVIGVSWDDFQLGRVFIPAIPTRNLLPQSTKFRSLALDADGYDLPSDWYMRIVSLAARALHRRNIIPELFPLESELRDNTTPRLPSSNLFANASEGHEACVSVLIDLLGEEALSKRRLTNIDLGPGKAQLLADFLSKVLDSTSLPISHTKMERILLLLSHLAQVFNVFPVSYELKGVDCDLNKPLDGGGFGNVYKAVHKDQAVCVKAIRIYEQQSNEGRLRALSKELVLWAHLFHVNVVPFYGVWIIESSPSLRIGIVSPWMENGNLSNYLTNNTEGASRLLLVSDVASGLEFLHRSGIVHADLKAANVLVSSTGRAMLTDFGASHVARPNPTTATHAAFTFHWAAPELLKEDDVSPSQASDVWAFGCVIYEVVSGKPPFYMWTTVQVMHKWVRGDKGLTPLKADPNGHTLQVDEPLRKLMKQCWNHNKQRRPRSEEIVRLFSELKLSDNRPLPTVDNSALTATHRAGSHIRIDYDQVHHALKLIHEAPAEESSYETENGRDAVNSVDDVNRGGGKTRRWRQVFKDWF
ncbi:hypothetical protein NP233_g12795 [Leucocoprinus birnbaumii]|uniref:Protein kinase domain-containing protein n=1 Tax=Leucocoprinus birnbaumii TaxID=56174 RepID=A0AAD5VF36_9AGAR|nr:hypothetical protein NP233_g12795 [Leucocoprinus birnbaumii]